MRDNCGRVNCKGCGKMGYSDEFQSEKNGHLCVRCARPDLDWNRWDKGGSL